MNKKGLLCETCGTLFSVNDYENLSKDSDKGKSTEACHGATPPGMLHSERDQEYPVGTVAEYLHPLHRKNRCI